MGLDMYLYRLSMVSDDEIKEINGKFVSDIKDGTNCIQKKYVTDHPNMYRDIMRVVKEVTLKESYINNDKIKLDFNIPTDAHVSNISYSDGNTTYGFYDNGNMFYATINNDDIDTYTLVKEEEYYVFHYSEIYYWRKAYETLDYIYESYNGDIENCGYHKLDQNTLDGLYRCGFIDYPIRDMDDVYYWEWY